jgi:hypothetical protein
LGERTLAFVRFRRRKKAAKIDIRPLKREIRSRDTYASAEGL